VRAVIDEVDKVDEEFEAMLLELLSAWQISIPKLGTVRHRRLPFVVMTRTKHGGWGIPPEAKPLLRIEYPNVKGEGDLAVRSTSQDEVLQEQLAGLAHALRAWSMEKPPSIAELP